ncbi:hypothetical protein K440DRAFT_164618 [Wilcoxina mikolae CBS 423.85]|nr:hypothetical protein K440DRAFT_164618 [Wilcoxina mikolae CBS 423.85]
MLWDKMCAGRAVWHTGFFFRYFLFADYLQYKFGHHSLNPASSKIFTQIRESSKISKVRRYFSGYAGHFESWRKFLGYICVFFIFHFSYRLESRS